MLRRALGKTGTTVSAIGLGCMGMSEFYGQGNDQQSLETLATALDQGAVAGERHAPAGMANIESA